MAVVLIAVAGFLPSPGSALVVWAQSSAPGESASDPAALLSEARAAAARARTSEVQPTPDGPEWRRAIALGRAALDAAPGDRDTLRFLARLHGEVRWYIRAWQYWERYFEAGGELRTAPQPEDGAGTPTDAELFAAAGNELGFARYEAGQPEAALPFYEGVVARLPGNAEALRWLGRIHFEQGRAAEALPYWERLTELRPDDEGVAYYLGVTRQRLAVGEAASQAFQRGLERYRAGEFGAALDAFRAAAEANRTFTEAFVWAGRTALETGRPAEAERLWQRVTELDPDDRRADYFLSVARDQQRWGVEAASAFYDGQAAYEAGDLEAARDAFERAAAANPDYLEALVWAARTAQEAGDPAEAIEYWQGVLRIDPDDRRAAFFLRQAEQQLTYGVEAGAAYAEALRAYQLADLDEAEAAFRRAVGADPEFAEAWGWLGRIAFERARYAEAVEAYGRAAELEPGDEDFAFFLEEARRLAEDGDGD